MREVLREAILTVMTAALAAAILLPTFMILKLLVQAGVFEAALPAVVGFGMLLAYLLRRETAGG
ncbi:MAG: hypothetical protein ABSB57_00165 [Dehalococcoidia bacterium]|jgi:hypothetical protein